MRLRNAFRNSVFGASKLASAKTPLLKPYCRLHGVESCHYGHSLLALQLHTAIQWLEHFPSNYSYENKLILKLKISQAMARINSISQGAARGATRVAMTVMGMSTRACVMQPCLLYGSLPLKGPLHFTQIVNDSMNVTCGWGGGGASRCQLGRAKREGVQSVPRRAEGISKKIDKTHKRDGPGREESAQRTEARRSKNFFFREGSPRFRPPPCLQNCNRSDFKSQKIAQLELAGHQRNRNSESPPRVLTSRVEIATEIAVIRIAAISNLIAGGWALKSLAI